MSHEDDAIVVGARCAGSPTAMLLARKGHKVLLRDERVLPTFEFACQCASFTPRPPEMQPLFAAMQGNQDAMDGFARVFAGVTSFAEFFSPENAGRILAASPVARSAA